jgi:hypothetical protein
MFDGNLRKMSTCLVFKVLEFLFIIFGRQFKIVSSLQSVHLKIPAAFINFDRAYLLNH